MSVRSLIVGAAAATLVLGGCGASHKGSTTTSSTPPASSGSPTASSSVPPGPASAALPPGAPPALRGVFGRVLRADELAGYSPQGRRLLGVNAGSWVVADQYPPAQRAREAARLRSLGFVAAVRERLAPAGGGPAEAISVVQQFDTPSAARAELAFETRQAPGSTPFAVPAIPGARGFGGSSSESSGQNVAFSKGSNFYLIGAGAPHGVAMPSRAALIAAARHLYGRLPS